jgi:hypothetical protein
MNITLELLKAFGLSGYAEDYFTQWFEENDISSLQYETALQLLKENKDIIVQTLEEAETDESYDYYINWFESLPKHADVITYLNEHTLLNVWRFQDEEFSSLEAAQQKQEEAHKILVENAKQYVSICAVTVNGDGTETYRSINLIDNVDPEDADFFEFTVQETGLRRRTTSATLAGIGLYQWMEVYLAQVQSKPIIEQKVQNGKYTAWIPIP